MELWRFSMTSGASKSDIRKIIHTDVYEPLSLDEAY
jgi:hypothetical protein